MVACSWPNLAAVVVQDTTRGIYIDELPCSAGTCAQVGDRVEVEGVTIPAEFAPQVHARRVTRLGPGELPQPLRPSRDELSNGSLRTHYVEIQGVVTATSVGGLTLLMPGGSLRILLFDLNMAPYRAPARRERVPRSRPRARTATTDPRARRAVTCSPVAPCSLAYLNRLRRWFGVPPC